MKIAVTSQDRRTITSHAGMCRRFWIYEIEGMGLAGLAIARREICVEEA